MLEEKWLLSELAGRDVGLEAAMEAYLASGRRRPRVRADGDTSIALDIDWSTGFDGPTAESSRPIRATACAGDAPSATIGP